MPAKHKFQCQNKFCNMALFVALTAPTPACPKCGAISVKDFGDTTLDLGYFQLAGGGVITGKARQEEKSLRAVAESFGMTNMSNKGGKAVKSAAVSPSGGPTVKVGGIDVPLSAAATGACVRMPGMSQSMKAPVGAGKTTASPMLSQQTRVVGRHKA